MEAQIEGIFEVDIILLALFSGPFQKRDETARVDDSLVEEFDDIKMA